MPVSIEIDGLEEVQRKFARFPMQYNKAERKTLEASLMTIHEQIPPYPTALSTSRYKRTGTLGRSIGANMSGGKSGKPEIYMVKQGGKYSEASFGTRLHYAPKVIGEYQDPFFAGRGWWNIKQVADFAKGKIERLWQIMADELANWLDGR